MTFTTCRHCHAAIRWCITEKHKRQALNVDPDPDGNVIVTHLDFYSMEHCRTLKKDEEYAGPRYMPHAATCTRKDS